MGPAVRAGTRWHLSIEGVQDQPPAGSDPLAIAGYGRLAGIVHAPKEGVLDRRFVRFRPVMPGFSGFFGFFYFFDGRRTAEVGARSGSWAMERWVAGGVPRL